MNGIWIFVKCFHEMGFKLVIVVVTFEKYICLYWLDSNVCGRLKGIFFFFFLFVCFFNVFFYLLCCSAPVLLSVFLSSLLPLHLFPSSVTGMNLCCDTTDNAIYLHSFFCK